MDFSLAKKRKAACEPPPPPGQAGRLARPGNDEPGTSLPANLSLADLNRLIDQRVEDAVEAKTLALEAKTLALNTRVDGLQRDNEELLLRCESLERSVQVLKREGNWAYSAPTSREATGSIVVTMKAMQRRLGISFSLSKRLRRISVRILTMWSSSAVELLSSLTMSWTLTGNS